MVNIGDFVTRNAFRVPGGDACIDPDTGRRTTHQRLADRVNRLANALLGELGLSPGDRVTMLSRNCAEYLELYYAAAKSGIIAQPLNWRLAVPELQSIIEDGDPRLLIYHGDFDAELEQLQRELDVEGWLRFEPGEPSAYEDLLARSSAEEPSIASRLGDDDPLFILYSGGTTGVAKGALHTHRTTFASMVNQNAIERVQPTDVYLLLGQMFHIPVVLAMNFLSHGRPVVLLNFEPRRTLEVIEEERVSGFLGVTTMLNYLLAEDLDKYDLSSLRLVQYGGGPMGEDVVREALARLPCGLMQGYGQTEGGPMTFLSAEVHAAAAAGHDTHRLRSCGQEAYLSSLRVVDEQGRLVPQDRTSVGEIVTNSEANMDRYWNRPALTAETLVDGWLHTGDLAVWDEEGFLYIVDRKKDMIISGGENIFPAQVENVLYKHPAVLEAAVFGVPDPVWGEAVKAVVALKPGAEVTEAELIELARSHLASYQKPKSVDFVEELPKSSTGKLLKRELRDPYWEDSSRRV